MTLVNILIDNYNYGRFLRDAIDSALNQTYPHVEVIVVDDGSTDESREIIASYGDRIIPILKENGGQASAFNAGFAASKGDLICFLDADDMSLPERAAEVVYSLSKYPDAEWCFHPLAPTDDDGVFRAHCTDPVPSDREDLRVQEHDLRAQVRSGRLKFIAPATSGLCFRRPLMGRILPMPQVGGILLADHYMKFAACGSAVGIYVDRTLGVQRIHGGNGYTGNARNTYVKGNVFLHTAFWLRRNFPELRSFCNNLFAVGLAMVKLDSVGEGPPADIVEGYFGSITLRERSMIYSKLAYHITRNRVSRMSTVGQSRVNID